MAPSLWKEIVGRGYKGSKTPVINYVTQLRQQLEEPDRDTGGRKPTTQPTPLSDHLYNPRQLTRWFMGRRDQLKGSQPDKLAQLCLNIPELGVTYKLGQQFQVLFRERQGVALSEWLRAAEGSGVGEVVSFARGIKRDEAAVRHGIELAWSQGPVEGEVNKLKLIKRTMYGRAKFEVITSKSFSGLT